MQQAGHAQVGKLSGQLGDAQRRVQRRRRRAAGDYGEEGHDQRRAAGGDKRDPVALANAECGQPPRGPVQRLLQCPRTTARYPTGAPPGPDDCPTS